MESTPVDCLGKRYEVDLTPRGFVVVDTDTGEVVRGTFAARFQARQVAEILNDDPEPPNPQAMH